jgi:hypothetical protein
LAKYSWKELQFGYATKFLKKNIGGAWDDTLSQFLFSTLTFAKTKRESLLSKINM